MRTDALEALDSYFGQMNFSAVPDSIGVGICEKQAAMPVLSFLSSSCMGFLLTVALTQCLAQVPETGVSSWYLARLEIKRSGIEIEEFVPEKRYPGHVGRRSWIV